MASMLPNNTQCVKHEEEYRKHGILDYDLIYVDGLNDRLKAGLPIWGEGNWKNQVKDWHHAPYPVLKRRWDEIAHGIDCVADSSGERLPEPDYGDCWDNRDNDWDSPEHYDEAYEAGHDSITAQEREEWSHGEWPASWWDDNPYPYPGDSWANYIHCPKDRKLTAEDDYALEDEGREAYPGMMADADGFEEAWNRQFTLWEIAHTWGIGWGAYRDVWDCYRGPAFDAGPQPDYDEQGKPIDYPGQLQANGSGEVWETPETSDTGGE